MAGVFGRSIAPSAQFTGRRLFGGAIAVSVLLHAVIAVAVGGVADWRLAEPEVTALTVDLVPPPEPEKPEPEEQEPSARPQSPPQPGEQPASPVLEQGLEFGETESGPSAEPGDRPEQDLQEREPDEPTPEPEQVAETEVAPDEPETVGPVAVPALPKPRPARNPVIAALETEEAPDAMVPAKHLYSDMMLSDPRVQAAMADTPRAERGKLLCMTEMRGQLLAASPPRRPEILPSFALPAGTVLEQRQAAFRSGGQWFDLAFRCEVDQPVTKVLSFSYRIGKAIPRSEWPQRGFPAL